MGIQLVALCCRSLGAGQFIARSGLERNHRTVNVIVVNSGTTPLNVIDGAEPCGLRSWHTSFLRRGLSIPDKMCVYMYTYKMHLLCALPQLFWDH